MNTRLFSFEGGNTGPWRVLKVATITGEPLTLVERLNIVAGAPTKTSGSQGWLLRGVTSNERYVQRAEKNELVARPLRKNSEWWLLTQDERREIFEESSKHIQIGMRYLPAVARRLHHCRDLGGNEPFDFLTWFEYAPSDEGAFDELLVQLRNSEEWKYVDREVDIRVVKG
jgi:hypothetical protein